MSLAFMKRLHRIRSIGVNNDASSGTATVAVAKQLDVIDLANLAEEALYARLAKDGGG
jgi:hypothetical protein